MLPKEKLKAELQNVISLAQQAVTSIKPHPDGYRFIDFKDDYFQARSMLQAVLHRGFGPDDPLCREAMNIPAKPDPDNAYSVLGCARAALHVVENGLLALYTEVSKQTEELKNAATLVANGDQPFSSAELPVVLARLGELKALVQTVSGQQTELQELTEHHFTLLEEQAAKASRECWFLMLLGTVLSVLVSSSLPAEQVRMLIQGAMQLIMESSATRLQLP